MPLAVKDSYLTKGITTTFGTSVLADFKPMRDAVAVMQLKDAGAIVFGKNNLVEMSYGLTGLNEHHGQVKNPYNDAHVTGGSSSGAGASVAARIVPAALGGDTVGFIRVPGSLCGVVGYKPTPGRWPTNGVAPISHTLDTTGLLARSVEDCDLVDAVLTSREQGSHDIADLKGVKLAYANVWNPIRSAPINPCSNSRRHGSIRNTSDEGNGIAPHPDGLTSRVQGSECNRTTDEKNCALLTRPFHVRS